MRTRCQSRVLREAERYQVRCDCEILCDAPSDCTSSAASTLRVRGRQAPLLMTQARLVHISQHTSTHLRDPNQVFSLGALNSRLDWRARLVRSPRLDHDAGLMHMQRCCEPSPETLAMYIHHNDFWACVELFNLPCARSKLWRLELDASH